MRIMSRPRLVPPVTSSSPIQISKGSSSNSKEEFSQASPPPSPLKIIHDCLVPKTAEVPPATAETSDHLNPYTHPSSMPTHQSQLRLVTAKAAALEKLHSQVVVHFKGGTTV
ncbi:uncharacterized protein LOC121993228 [Zingiber officinale]|uniref:uncharacterized protein LOC121993228 n=1 Tax=Zingiber officinale TaxID=94328 RepID=UPI001C4D8722|nr:uncharacterized protein LOC121993228 [Zingiber officinale]